MHKSLPKSLPNHCPQAIGRLLKPKSLRNARLACRGFCDGFSAAASGLTIDLSKPFYGPRLSKLLKLLDASATVTILIPLAHTSPAAPLRKLLADAHPNCRLRLLVSTAAQVPPEAARRLVLGLRRALMEEHLAGRTFLLSVPRFTPPPRSLDTFLDWRRYDEMLQQESALHAASLMVSSSLMAHALPLGNLETASIALGSLDHRQLRHLAGCARLRVRRRLAPVGPGQQRVRAVWHASQPSTLLHT
jgi:hypothetical protein